MGKQDMYQASGLLRSGHINTIYPTLFRKQDRPDYNRSELTTPDNDVLHLDCLKSGNKRVAILCHGLEGSSQSKYIIGTSGILHENGWDTIAINYRGCSGEINNQLRIYHSGATDDIDTVINECYTDYDEIALVGFSLGGNLVLKYCGERGSELRSSIITVVAVSVPTDLKAGSINIGKKSNFIYEQKFLKSLTKKLLAKHKQFPDAIDLSLLKKVKKLYDFDEYYTGPLHGFTGADDYYAQSSSEQFLPYINIPGLIINALDDPFLPQECYPYDIVRANDCLEFIMPKHGGHVGFVDRKHKYYWSERAITSFLNKKSKLTTS